MTTPSDDEILAAVRANVPEHCCMWDAENKLIDAWGLDRDEMLRLYRAAFAAGRLAGMDEAAVICDERKKRLLQWGLISAASEAGQAADAIRAAKP